MRPTSIWQHSRLLLPAAACLAFSACATAPARPAQPRPPGRAPAPPANAAVPRSRQAADESYQVSAGEISDDVLRRMVGIVTVSAGIGAGGEEQAVPIYDNAADADRFTLSGSILLSATRPVSVFHVGADAIVNRSRAAVRRYPLLARQGVYVKAALEPGGRRTGWLRRTPEGAFPNSVDIVEFDDAGSFRCYQLDLYFLAGAAQRKLFEKPDPAAAFTILAAKPGAPGFLTGDVVPLQRKGNFLEIAAVRGLDDPRTGIGWVELKDAGGRLTVWFAPGPEC